MMRDEFESRPCSPAQRVLCEEFAAWAARQGVPVDRGADDPLILNMMSRDQRAWLSNFIARWDWSSENDARAPSALRTPIELAGMFMTVVRENSSRGEFARVLAGEWAPVDYMDVGSVMSSAFARLHRVPIDGPRTLNQQQAEDRLKAAALSQVNDFLIRLAKV